MVSSDMNAKHQRTLTAIFEKPVRSNVAWSDVEALLVALGAVSEGRSSRVRVEFGGQDAVFHRPHPKPDTDKGALVAVRRMLEAAGVKP
jgi:hypothetical protein